MQNPSVGTLAPATSCSIRTESIGELAIVTIFTMSGSSFVSRSWISSKSSGVSSKLW